MFGGALSIDIYNVLTLSDNTFQNNAALRLAGGMLYILTNNTLTLRGSICQNNSAGMYGGALIIKNYNILILLKHFRIIL